MAAALQTVTFFKQGLTGGAFESLAPATGDSATFFNIPQNTGAYLAEIWAVDNANPCELSFTASRFHDQQFGIRTAVPSGALLAPTTRPVNVSPAGFDQPIYPSDVLTVQANGTAADNVNVTIQLYYPNLPGVMPRLATTAFVRQNTRNLVGVRVSPTSGAGTYGATVALNSVTNLLHADTDYALLGFTAQTPIASLVVQGIGVGLFQVAYADLVLATLPVADRGIAGSLTMVTRTIGVVGGATALSAAFRHFEGASLAAGAPPAQAFLSGFQSTFICAAACTALCFAIAAVRRRTAR